MNHAKFQQLIKQLYSTVRELEQMFPGRHFTPDGHMVGSIGECLVADAYGLELKKASNKGFDATARDGRQVEIKATQSKTGSGRVGFRSEPEHTVVIRILPDGAFAEVYNGPGKPIWEKFAGKKRPKNGQYSISVKQLSELNKTVQPTDRLNKQR
ncbi:MAG: hypothetical protein GDA55_07155 [Cellvibrionales bacterium]|nr:hypothetical protein [Cellvibrionales bacterium]